ncbi:MAG: enoyl-CoA hydratase-related protein, partial [Pseudomonadota bacterium]
MTALAEYEFIVTERRGDVLGISLNRPDRLNAAPPAMFDEIRAAVADLDGARAVLLMGIGRGFCSGADVSDSARTVRSEEASYRALTEHYHPALLAL